MRHVFLLALALAAGIALPAAAQNQTQLGVPATASWKHAATGVILRPRIAGLARGAIVDSSAAELDVMVQYAEGEATAVTLYLFRPSVANVPMWFDRSETQILLRTEIFGNSNPSGPARPFAAPHAATASALQRIYAPGRGPNRSTGLAVIPLGEWLVAVRISSTELDPAALDAKLGEVIAGIAWPEKIAESPVAAPVAPCAGALAYDKKAKPMKPDIGQSLLGALVFGAAQDAAAKREVAAPPVLLCREGTPTAQYGVYRAPDSRDSYMIAVGDAGRTVNVSPALSLDDKKAGYGLSFGALDRRLIFPNFSGLPSPETAIAAVQKLQPMSSIGYGGKEVTINAK